MKINSVNAARAKGKLRRAIDWSLSRSQKKRTIAFRQFGVEHLESRVMLFDGVDTPLPDANAILPAQVRALYGLDNSSGQSAIQFGTVDGDGTGQTITIVVAYDDPNILSDTNNFSAYYNLPQFVGAGPKLTVVNQAGDDMPLPSTVPDVQIESNLYWGAEESMDVQWAHVMAPEANILVVECIDKSFSNLILGIGAAERADGVSVVSMSIGVPETSDTAANDSLFTTPSGHQGITFVASSGDNGATGTWPAISPNVVAAGGTTYNVSGTETGWSGSGGRISQTESQPSYQENTVTQSTSQRTIPDVAALAHQGADPDPNVHGAVSVYDSFDGSMGSPWYRIGGTSLSAPLWAGVIADADQGRVENGLATLDGATETLPDLYKLPATDFNDITTGTSTGTPHYSAGQGYDLVTGLGSPVANLLVSDLAGLPRVGSFAVDNAVPQPGDNITLTAFATYQMGGNVDQIEVWRGTSAGQSLAEVQADAQVGAMVNDGSGTWTLSTSTSGVDAGTYFYYAVARGSSGNLLSSPVSVVVVVGGSGAELPAALQTAISDDTTVQNQLGVFLSSSASASPNLTTAGEPLAQPLDTSANGILSQITPYLDHNLPVVGDKLDQAITFLNNLEGVVQNAEAQLKTYEAMFDPSKTNASLALSMALQNELNQVSATGKSIADGAAASLGIKAASVGAVSFNASDLTNPNSGTPLTDKSVIPNVVQFNLDLQGSYDFGGIPIDANIGVPGLGLTIAQGSNLTIAVKYAIYLHFGFIYDSNHPDVAPKFYLDTDPARGDSKGVDYLNDGKPLAATTPVIGLALGVFLTDPSNSSAVPFSGTGTLGPLQLDFHDHKGTTDFYSGEAGTYAPSNFSATLGLSLYNGSDAQHNSVVILGAGDNSAPSFTPAITISGAATINLDMELTFGGDTAYPSIAAEFHLGWGFGTGDQSAQLMPGTPESSFGNAPTLDIDHIAIGVGTFLSGFVKTIVNDAYSVLSPLKPIVTLLNTTMPIFNDFAPLQSYVNGEIPGNPPTKTVTVASFLSAVSGDDEFSDFAVGIQEVYDLHDALNSPSLAVQNVFIPIGGIKIGSLRSLQTGSGGLSSLSPSDYSTENLATDEGGEFTSNTSGLSDADNPTLSNDLVGRNSTLSAGGGGFDFPILDDPLTVISLLLGNTSKPPVLFTYTAPTVEINGFSLDEAFPIIGPIVVYIKGGLPDSDLFSITANLKLGYDSSGLLQFAKDGKLADLDQGFYLDTGTTNGMPNTGIAFNFAIEVDAGIDLEIVSAGVGGGIEGSVILAPVNPGNANNRLYISTILSNPGDLFGLSGSVSAYLGAFWKVGIGPFSIGQEYHIASIKILDFAISLGGGGKANDVSVGTLDNGRLVLAIGNNASSGSPLAKDVHVVVTEIAKPAGDPISGDDVEVTAFSATDPSHTYTKDFDGVTEIYADAAAGQNNIDIESGVTANVYIYAGTVADASVLAPVMDTETGVTLPPPQAEDYVNDDGTGAYYIQTSDYIPTTVHIGGGSPTAAGTNGSLSGYSYGGEIVGGMAAKTILIDGYTTSGTGMTVTIEGSTINEGIVRVITTAGDNSVSIGSNNANANVTGGTGSDVLDISAQNDTVTGGAGRETFVVHAQVPLGFGFTVGYGAQYHLFPFGQSNGTTSYSDLVIYGADESNTFTVTSPSSNNLTVTDQYAYVTPNSTTNTETFSIPGGSGNFQSVDIEGNNNDTYNISDVARSGLTFLEINLDEFNDQQGSHSQTTLGGFTTPAALAMIGTYAVYQNGAISGEVFNIGNFAEGGPVELIADDAGDSLNVNFPAGSNIADINNTQLNGALTFNSNSDPSDTGTDSIAIEQNSAATISLLQNGHNLNVTIGDHTHSWYTENNLGTVSIGAAVVLSSRQIGININGGQIILVTYRGTVGVTVDDASDQGAEQGFVTGDKIITGVGTVFKPDANDWLGLELENERTIISYIYANSIVLDTGDISGGLLADTAVYVRPTFSMPVSATINGLQFGATAGTVYGLFVDGSYSQYPITVNGSSGNDTLNGTGEGDYLDGGAGDDDVFDIWAGTSLLETAKGDTLLGSDGIDHLGESGGNSFLAGGAGNDTLTYTDRLNIYYPILQGGTGSNLITEIGGMGNIYINGPVPVAGQDGDSTVDGTAADATIFGGAGTDTFSLGFGSITLPGTSFQTNNAFGPSVIYFGTGRQYLYGGTGSDTVFGGTGQDLLEAFGTGGTTPLQLEIDSGTLTADVPNIALSAVDLTVLAGAMFNLNDNNQTVGSLSGNGNVSIGTATFTIGADNLNTTFGGILSGTGTLIKTGIGTTSMVAAAHVASTLVQGGTLRMLGGSAQNYLTNFTKTNDIWTTLNQQYPHTGTGTPGVKSGTPNASFLFDPTAASVLAAGYAPNYISGSNLVNNGIAFNLTSDSGGHDFSEILGGATLPVAANLFNVSNIYLLLSAYFGTSVNITFTGADGTTQTFNNISLPDFNAGSPINTSGTNFTDQTVFQVHDVGGGITGNTVTGVLNNYDLTELAFALSPGLAHQQLTSISILANGNEPLVLGITALQTNAWQSAVNVSAGATFDVNNLTMGVGSLAGAGHVLLGTGQLTTDVDNTNTTFSGVISGSGTLVKTGTGNFTLTGANTYTGNTTINGGTLTVGDGAAQPIVSNVALAGGTLTFNRSDIYTYPGTISGSGTLIQAGTGTTSLGVPAHTGSTLIQAGKLRLLSNLSNAMPSSANITSGATFDVNSLAVSVGSIAGAGSVLLGTGQLTAGTDGTSTTYSGVISDSGGGSVTKVGNGTWTLSGSSTYTGAFNDNGGTVNFNSLAALGMGTAININAAILQYATGNLSDISTRTTTINSGGATIDTNGNTVTYANSIGNSGVGLLIKVGTGTLSLHAQGTWTGGTTINGGTLKATAANVLPTATGLTVNSGDTFDLNSLNQSVGSLAGAGIVTLGSAILTTGAGGNNNSTTFSGVISGTGGLTTIGTGTFTLLGANTYTGPTNVNAGTVQLAQAPLATLPSPAVLYTFNDPNDSGTTLVNDGTLANKNGTFSSASEVAGIAGAPGGGKVLQLTNAHGEVLINPTNGKGVDLSGGAWTAGLWFNGLYPSASYRTAFHGTITTQTPISINTGGYSLGSYINGFVSTNYKVDGSGTPAINVTTGWHQVTAVGSAGSTSFYIDGSFVGSIAGEVVTDIYSIANISVNNNNETFANFIADASIYQTALSAAQVQALYLTQLNPFAGGSLASTTVNVASGATLNVNVNGGLSSSAALTSNGTTNFAPNASTGILTRTLASMTIGANGKVIVSAPATHLNRTMLVTSALNFAGSAGSWQGQLDLAGNDLLVHGGVISNLQQQLAEGLNARHGYWNGSTGIVSTTAAADSRFLTTLGYRPGGIALDGVNTTSTDVLVKYTYYGDADLNGSINGADYQQIDTGFGGHATVWFNGDFNYDGVVDGTDYSLIDNAFNQLTAIGATPLAITVPARTTSVGKMVGVIDPDMQVKNSSGKESSKALATSAVPQGSVSSIFNDFGVIQSWKANSSYDDPTDNNGDDYLDKLHNRSRLLSHRNRELN
jgi:autotransporter-associated beta strand protein